MSCEVPENDKASENQQQVSSDRKAVDSQNATTLLEESSDDSHTSSVVHDGASATASGRRTLLYAGEDGKAVAAALGKKTAHARAVAGPGGRATAVAMIPEPSKNIWDQLQSYVSRAKKDDDGAKDKLGDKPKTAEPQAAKAEDKNDEDFVSKLRFFASSLFSLKKTTDSSSSAEASKTQDENPKL